MKIVRIVLSPIYFLILMLAGIVIPIWVISSFMGMGSILYNLLMGKNISLDDIMFTFAFLTLPYYSTKKFINGEIEI